MRPRIKNLAAKIGLSMASIAGLAVALTGPAFAQSADWREGATYMRLLDDLDRPQDGWCLDAVGSGAHIRLDMPLMGHNCKPGLYPDKAVVFRDDGVMYFPAFDRCVTVMGLNRYALPGAALMLKPCGEASPFLNAPRFQRFEHRADGRVSLAGTGLCITLGDESRETYSDTHAWRTLYVDRCDDIDPSRASWKFIDPLNS